MDLLSDIIAQSGWKHDLLAKEHIYQSFGFYFPCERSGGFHIVTQGSCFVRAKGILLELKKGDLLFITRGIHHELISDEKAKVVGLERFKSRIKNQKQKNNPITTFVSVRYEIPAGPMHPLFMEIPDIIHLPFEEVEAHHALTNVVLILSQELDLNLGSDLIVQRLTDILLYYLLRIWLEKNKSKSPGWIQTFHDKTIMNALERIHSNIQFEWTIDSLARTLGISRANLASRFKEVLGVPPMEYLTKLRMEKATHLYANEKMGLEEIAQKVGYSSAFSFSKAFKRIYGHAPSYVWKKAV
ncbi:AraC family transcriptional regulator [Leptospira sp. 96542]|nr:AraC family transcriptional regulator [Leptospira sp. 96542]